MLAAPQTVDEQGVFTVPSKMYRLSLTDGEREDLKSLANKGRASAQKQTHARILLQCDEDRAGGGRTDAEVADALDIGIATVARVRRRCVEEGIEAALNRKPQANRRRKVLDGEAEARLVAVACGAPPEGCAKWTLRLLADRLVELEVVESVSTETVRRTLKKTISSRG
jgi:transposase